MQQGHHLAAIAHAQRKSVVAAKKGEAAADVKRRRWQDIPGWLVVTCKRSEDTLQAQEDYAACCCAVHNITLYLWSHGIGCKWTTGAVTRDQGFYQRLKIDAESEELVSLLWYGYPDQSPQTKRKPVKDILFALE
jgi:nitroreductase